MIQIPLHCNRTGSLLGVFTPASDSLPQPYLETWKDTLLWHPAFSLAARDWLQRTPTGPLFIAGLHLLGSIQQTAPCLPEEHQLLSHWDRLRKLVAWKHALASRRFAFPTLLLSPATLAFISDYLSSCEEAIASWEAGINEAQEKEQARIARAMAAALQDTWIEAPSLSLLFSWVRAQLATRWLPDADGWLQTLFLGKPAAIRAFEREDLELMEEIIFAHCPAGTGPLFHVRKRVAEIIDIWKSHHEAWEILEDESEEKPTASPPLTEPQLLDFPTRASWLQAMARWKLSQRKG